MKYILLLLFFPLYSHAQKPLSIGDKMPDWKFTPFINGKESIQLSSYKGKPLMIAFWISSCGGCLNMLGKTDGLRKKFKDDFSFIFISDDKDPAQPISLMSRRTDLKNLQIPVMKSDSAFFNLFPHNGDPHVILVGKDGFIKAVTGSQYITENVISDLIAGKEIKLPLQKPSLTYEEENSLFGDGFLNDSVLLYNSVLTGYIDNLSAGFKSKVLPGNRLRLSVDNITLPDLYATAYSNRLPLSPGDPLKTLIINAKDKKELDVSIDDPLERKQKYCYELIVPRGNNKTNAFALDYMKTDLDRYFNITTAIEKRLVTCYGLIPKNASKTSLKDKHDQYIQTWPGNIDLHNQLLSGIIGQIDYLCRDAIFIMDNNAVDRYTLTLKDKYDSLEELKNDLKTAGFELVPVQKELEFLILNEK
jgi:hypothetical protein